MAAPVSLLKGARAFARDMAREGMAPGYLWDVVDFVPAFIDSMLTGRGAWPWGSDVGAAADYEAGILAPYTTGEQNLAAANGTLYQVGNDPPYPLTSRGSVPVARQNPVMLFDQVIWMSGDGATSPSMVPPSGAPIVISGTPAVKVGTTWGAYFVGGNVPTQEDTIWWSATNNVLLPWDANAFWRTSGAVTGLAALRTAILIFHASSVERLRGTRPPAGTSDGDMVLEPLFNQVGTTEPKSIAYWQENVLFADEHGVHITDGAVLRNLVQQGQIQGYWRNLYNKKQSISAAVFLDYYVISVTRTDGLKDTLVCDLGARLWFRISNVSAKSMWGSGGTVGMERLWGGMIGTQRLARLSSMFFPVPGGALQQDANGINVLPSFETAYYKLSAEGRKRVRFVYLSYDARTSGLVLRTPHLTPEDFDLPESAPAVAGDLLQVGYILSPQDTNWTIAGTYPPTSEYRRYRLPVGKFPYGIAFQVKQIAPTTVTRISDLAVDAHAGERSRI